MEIAFEGISLDVVDHNNQKWLRGPQIAAALGLRDARGIADLFGRHEAEFVDSMTAVIKLDTPGGKQSVRIFSQTGCWLLGMLARTERAARFRVWVLGVLQQHTATPALPAIAPPTPDKIIEATRVLQGLMQAGRALGLPRGRAMVGANAGAQRLTGCDLVEMLGAHDVVADQLRRDTLYRGAPALDVISRAAELATHEDAGHWYFTPEAFGRLCGDYPARATAALLRQHGLLLSEHGRVKLKAPTELDRSRTRYYVLSKASVERAAATSSLTRGENQ